MENGTGKHLRPRADPKGYELDADAVVGQVTR